MSPGLLRPESSPTLPSLSIPVQWVSTNLALKGNLGPACSQCLLGLGKAPISRKAPQRSAGNLQMGAVVTTARAELVGS